MTDREGIIRLATEYMGCCAVVKSCSPEHDNLIFTGERVRRFAVYHKDQGPIHLCGDFRNAGSPWNPFESPTDAYELESSIPEAKRRLYSVILNRIVTDQTPHELDSWGTLYWIAHATPRQRSQAALEIIKESE